MTRPQKVPGKPGTFFTLQAVFRPLGRGFILKNNQIRDDGFQSLNQICIRRHRQEWHPFLDQCLGQVPPGQLLKRGNHVIFKALFLEICSVPSEMEQKEPTETLAPGARCAIGDFRKGFENGTCSTTSIMLMTSHFPQASNHREPCNAPRCQRFSVVRHCPRVDQAQWGESQIHPPPSAVLHCQTLWPATDRLGRGSARFQPRPQRSPAGPQYCVQPSACRLFVSRPERLPHR